MIRVDPSPILFYFYFFYRSELVRVDPSWSDPDWRSELIRSDFCTCLFWLADSANVNQSKKWAADISLKVCIRLSFHFALPAGSNFQSETKIEPDLRLLETLPDILSLSLAGVRLGPKQARQVNDSTASLSLAERWTITEIRRSSNSVLTYSLLTDVLPL